MSFNIYTTDFFDKELKSLSRKYPSVKKDFMNLIDLLKEDPMQGQPLGKDCYKKCAWPLLPKVKAKVVEAALFLA